MLAEDLIQKLVEAIAVGSKLTGFDGQWVRAIGLTGSHARGTATPFSDIDLHVYVPAQGTPPHEHYQLHRFEGHLVSITVTTIESKYADLEQPQSAVDVVSGLRQTRILYDSVQLTGHGLLASLRQAALDFDWTPLQPAADAFASQQLAGCAEEAHKLLSGLLKNDEALLLYATYGLVLGLVNVVAVQKGILVESENVLFQAVQDAADAEWSELFRIAAGWDANPVRMRALAGLGLYAATARMLRGIIAPEHETVINWTLERIADFRATNNQ
ncbi:MAG: nucleotidyltransferase domain-containing protein [Anaerolineae bacterium]|nr:nucleotidyltransferase domain-containing protein [Anaerolineae bacterium]